MQVPAGTKWTKIMRSVHYREARPPPKTSWHPMGQINRDVDSKKARSNLVFLFPILLIRVLEGLGPQTKGQDKRFRENTPITPKNVQITVKTIIGYTVT